MKASRIRSAAAKEDSQLGAGAQQRYDNLLDANPQCVEDGGDGEH